MTCDAAGVVAVDTTRSSRRAGRRATALTVRQRRRAWQPHPAARHRLGEANKAVEVEVGRRRPGVVQLPVPAPVVLFPVPGGPCILLLRRVSTTFSDAAKPSRPESPQGWVFNGLGRCKEGRRALDVGKGLLREVSSPLTPQNL